MVLVGYACVSTLDQEPSLQEDALRAAACERIFGDRASGALADRPELARALEDARAGNTLAVWRLDCLDRSLRHLVETVTVLEKRGDGLCSLTELIDTTTRGGGLSSTSSRRWRSSERDCVVS